MAEAKSRHNISLIDKIGMGEPLQLSETTENAWIEVIQ